MPREQTRLEAIVWRAKRLSVMRRRKLLVVLAGLANGFRPASGPDQQTGIGWGPVATARRS
jgi:hypothetical protein